RVNAQFDPGNRNQQLRHQEPTATARCIPSRQNLRILAGGRAWPGNPFSDSPVAKSGLRIRSETRRLATFRRVRPRLSPAAGNGTHGPLGIYLAHAAGIGSIGCRASSTPYRSDSVTGATSHLLRISHHGDTEKMSVACRAMMKELCTPPVLRGDHFRSVQTGGIDFKDDLPIVS